MSAVTLCLVDPRTDDVSWLSPIPVGGRRNDIIAIVVGTVLYLALGLWFHPYVIGKSVFSEMSVHATQRRLTAPDISLIFQLNFDMPQ